MSKTIQVLTSDELWQVIAPIFEVQGLPTVVGFTLHIEAKLMTLICDMEDAEPVVLEQLLTPVWLAPLGRMQPQGKIKALTLKGGPGRIVDATFHTYLDAPQVEPLLQTFSNIARGNAQKVQLQ